MHAGIYIRKSRKSEDSSRLEAQRVELPRHAKAQGWSYVLYDDGHASASQHSLGKLKERRRLEQDVIAGKIKVILVIELSRLSRDETMQDYVYWLSLCSDHGVKIATPQQVYNPADPNHFMQLILGGVNRH